jgi:hypothetical protein
LAAARWEEQFGGQKIRKREQKSEWHLEVICRAGLATLLIFGNAGYNRDTVIDDLFNLSTVFEVGGVG